MSRSGNLPSLDRFEAFFDKTDRCWNWKGSKQTQGYGKIKVGGRTFRAHRLAFELYIGAVPDKIFVCHKCDNPACVNPDHLFLGTPKQNTHDMLRKGRWVQPPSRKPGTVRGSKNFNSRLKEAEVLKIKALLRDKVLNKDIAKRFDVVPKTISDIKLNKTWSWLELGGINE